MNFTQRVSEKRNQWNNSAELAIIRILKNGDHGKLVSQRWANGKTMTGPRGGLPNQFIPRERAVGLFRHGRDNGWKFKVDDSGSIIL